MFEEGDKVRRKTGTGDCSTALAGKTYTVKYKLTKGDRVRILSGQYTGQKATVSFLMSNGAMVERDSEETGRFCSVMFEHLELLTHPQ